MTDQPNPYSPYATADPKTRHIFPQEAFFPAPVPGWLTFTACGAMAVVPPNVIEVMPDDELPDGMCRICVGVMTDTAVVLAEQTTRCVDCAISTTHGELCAMCRMDKHNEWAATQVGDTQ